MLCVKLLIPQYIYVGCIFIRKVYYVHFLLFRKKNTNDPGKTHGNTAKPQFFKWLLHIIEMYIAISLSCFHPN